MMTIAKRNELLANPKSCLVSFYNEAMVMYITADKTLLFGWSEKNKGKVDGGEGGNSYIMENYFKTKLPIVLINKMIAKFGEEYNANFRRETGEVVFL